MANMGALEADDVGTEFRQRQPLRYLPLEHAMLVAAGTTALAGDHEHEFRIIALRPAQETKQRGMGLALPAESNGYPGPRHVLELADQIGLNADQKAQTQALFDSMQAKAKQLGG